MRANTGVGVVLASVFLCVLGCSGSSSGPAVAAPPAPDFDPPAPLADPPAPDPGADGADYLATVYRRLGPSWGRFLDDCRTRLPPSHELNQPSLQAAVAIVVTATGDLASVTLEQSSGLRTFDQGALEVAADLGQLPVPSAALLSDDDQVHLRWRFARDVRQAGPGTAEIVRVTWPIEKLVPALVRQKRLAAAALRLRRAVERELAQEPADAGKRARLSELLDSVAEAVLVRALQHGDRASRAEVARLSAVVGRKAWVPALRAIVLGAGDVGIRADSLRGIAAIDGEAQLSLFRRIALGVGEPAILVSVATTALLTLGLHDDVETSAQGALQSTDDKERWRGLLLASHLPVPGAQDLLTELLVGVPRAQRLERMAAAQALGIIAGKPSQSGDQALSALIGHLDEPDASVREAVVRALWSVAHEGITSPRAYRKLLPRLADADERVRGAAVLAAAELSPAKFVRQLWRVRTETSVSVLSAYAESLGAHPSADGRRMLLAWMNHSSGIVRLAAAQSLLTAKAAEPALVKNLLASNDTLVFAAALAASTDRQALRSALFGSALEPKVAALGRLADLDRLESMADAATLIAQAADGSSVQVALAGAWLASGHRPGQATK